jgi:4-hydroxy-4-methyl-2-oxoglutarate aldolase
MNATDVSPHTYATLDPKLIERFMHPRMSAEHVYSGGASVMSNRIQPMLEGRRFVGRALTVRTLPGFTRRSLEALSLAKAGDVLVIAAGGPSELSSWGGMVHWNATRDKLAAVVVDGPTRDLVEIRALPDAIPLYGVGRGAGIAGFGTPTVGTIGETVICGGVSVSNGDLIFGDDDGIAVVPWGRVHEIIDLAEKSIIFDDKEQQWVESGRSVFDMLVMLSGRDGSDYKARKFRWVAQQGIEPLAD